jgi:hypothetical protein
MFSHPDREQLQYDFTANTTKEIELFLVISRSKVVRIYNRFFILIPARGGAAVRGMGRQPQRFELIIYMTT